MKTAFMSYQMAERGVGGWQVFGEISSKMTHCLHSPLLPNSFISDILLVVNLRTPWEVIESLAGAGDVLRYDSRLGVGCARKSAVSS